MKQFGIFILLIVTALVMVAPANAQFTISKEEIEAAMAKAQAESEEKGGSSRRRGGAAAGGGKNDSGKFQGWSNIKLQAAAAPERKRKSFTWGSISAGAPAQAGKEGIQSAIQKIIKKQITVIDGDRVIDAVTGELLDDARKIRVDEEKKDEYFDDGTHGDLVAGDGQYTRVNKITDVIGPNNQRIKEQLIQAVYEVSRLDPVEFYGHNLASVDHKERPERYKRWALVDASEGNVGFRISEIDTEKSVEVPNYWEEQLSRDMKVAGPNGWARTFLDEYRVKKGGIDSGFYTPYVPQPPTIPTVPPPPVDGWTPFVNEYDPEEGIIEGASKGGSGKGGNSDAGAAAALYASKFANRGAGKGSTSAAGGYFNGQ